MARRPDFTPKDTSTRNCMTLEELQTFRRNLLMLSPYSVKQKFREAADKCRFLELPPPRVMQELITIWRVLWQWRK